MSQLIKKITQKLKKTRVRSSTLPLVKNMESEETLSSYNTCSFIGKNMKTKDNNRSEDCKTVGNPIEKEDENEIMEKQDEARCEPSVDKRSEEKNDLIYDLSTVGSYSPINLTKAIESAVLEMKHKSKGRPGISSCPSHMSSDKTDKTSCEINNYVVYDDPSSLKRYHNLLICHSNRLADRRPAFSEQFETDCLLLKYVLKYIVRSRIFDEYHY